MPLSDILASRSDWLEVTALSPALEMNQLMDQYFKKLLLNVSEELKTFSLIHLTYYL